MAFFLSCLLLYGCLAVSLLQSSESAACQWSFNTTGHTRCSIRYGDLVQIQWTYQPTTFGAKLHTVEVTTQALFSNGSEKEYPLDIHFMDHIKIGNRTWSDNHPEGNRHLVFLEYEKKTDASGVMVICRPRVSEIQKLNISVKLMDGNRIRIRSNVLEVHYNKDYSSGELQIEPDPLPFFRSLFIKNGQNAIINLTPYNMPNLYLNDKSYLVVFDGEYDLNMTSSYVKVMNEKYSNVMSPVAPLLIGNETYISKYSVRIVAARGSTKSNSHTVTIEVLNRKRQPVVGHYCIWALSNPEIEQKNIIIGCEINIPLLIKNFDTFFFLDVMASVPLLNISSVVLKKNNIITADVVSLLSNLPSKIEVHVLFKDRVNGKLVFKRILSYDLCYISKDWNELVNHSKDNGTSKVDLRVDGKTTAVVVGDQCFGLHEYERLLTKFWNARSRKRKMSLQVLPDSLFLDLAMELQRSDRGAAMSAHLRVGGSETRNVTFVVVQQGGDDTVEFRRGVVSMKPEERSWWSYNESRIAIGFICLLTLISIAVLICCLKCLKKQNLQKP